MTTSADRQAKYRARMREKGYIRPNAWIPEEYRDEFEQFVLELDQRRKVKEKKR